MHSQYQTGSSFRSSDRKNTSRVRDSLQKMKQAQKEVIQELSRAEQGERYAPIPNSNINFHRLTQLPRPNTYLTRNSTDSHNIYRPSYSILSPEDQVTRYAANDIIHKTEKQLMQKELRTAKSQLKAAEQKIEDMGTVADQNLRLKYRNSILEREYKVLEQQIRDQKTEKATISTFPVATRPIENRRSQQADLMLQELAKINSIHDQMFQKLKYINSSSNYSSEDQYQRSFSRLLNFFEALNKNSRIPIYNVDQSVILTTAKADTEGSFRQDFKKFEKELFKEDEIKKQKSELKKQINILKLTIKELETQKEKEKDAKVQSQNARDKLEKENHNLLAERDKLQGKLTVNQNLSKELDQKGKLVMAMEEDLQQKKKELSERNRDYANIVRVMQTIQQQMKTLINERQQISKTYHKMEREKTVINQVQEESSAYLKEINQHLKLAVDKHEMERKIWQKQTEKCKQQLQKLTAELEQALGSRENLQQELNAVRNENKRLQKVIMVSEQQEGKGYQQYLESLKHKNMENQQLRGELSGLVGLRRQITILEQQIVGMQAILKRNKKLDTTIDHLWEIKECEYLNIDTILKSVIDPQPTTQRPMSD